MRKSFFKMSGLLLSVVSMFFLLAGLFADEYLGGYGNLVIAAGIILLTLGIVFLKVMCDN